MQLRYVFSELRQGLRRNLSMHVAVVLTLFVALTLVGLGVLLFKQAEKAADFWGNQLEITAWLCNETDTQPGCSGEVSDAQRAAIIKVIEDNPEVADYRTESKQEAFDKVKELYPGRFDGKDSPITADAMHESIWIQLKDPREYEGITSAVQGLDGVSSMQDMRNVLEPIYGVLSFLLVGSIVTAVVLVIAALLLVSNTIRLAALARRREIGIMRLVGASNLYISLPFLMEAIVTAVIGVLLAAGALAAFMWFAIHERASDQLQFMPWIGLDAYLVAVAVIAIVGPLLTVLPTLILTRFYIRV